MYRIVNVALIIAVVLPSIAGARNESPANDVQISELQQLLNRGRYAEVEQRARGTLEVLSQDGRSRTLYAAHVLDALVVALWRSGRASRDDAVAFAERAIEIKEAVLGADSPALAKSLDNAGVLFFVRGAYERALSLYERAASIWQAAAANDPQYRTDLGTVHSHLGPLYQELGQYTSARRHYELALAIFVETLGSADRRVAMSRNNLATLMARIGDYGAAATLYRKSLSSLESGFGAEHPLIARAKHNLGELNQRLGFDDEAIAFYSQSIALKEKVLGADHPSLALTLGNLGYLHADRGDIDAAEPLVRRALAIHEAAYGPEHVELAYSLISLGRVQAARGDARAASGTFERALRLRTEALGEDNPLVVAPLYFLSRARLQAGAHREAFELALRAEAIGREHLRLTARGAPERQALRYAEERLSSLDTALSIAQEMPDAAAPRAAWDALIRSRAVVFDEMASRHRLAARETGAAVRAAFAAYRSSAEGLSNVLLRGPAADDVAAYRRQVAELRAAKEAAERALAAESEAVRRGLAERDTGFAEVRASLPDNAALVAYARIGGDARSFPPAAEYLAFVLDDPEAPPRSVPLGSARDIDAAIRRWRDAMRPEAPAGDGRRFLQAGERLRALIWDPLGIRTADDGLVLIVPAGPIHLVNFAALPGADSGFLVETDILIHYLASERDVLVGPRAGGDPRLLVVGGIDADAAPRQSAPGAASLAAEGGASPETCSVRQGIDLPPLPGSLREARRISSIWEAAAGESSVTELVNGFATEDEFKRHAEGKTVVHVATHGFFLANTCLTDRLAVRSPLRLSGLVLSRDSARGEDGAGDGLLIAEDVATMDFSRAEWVVLSGCDTGLGRIQIDEGILGLRRAFRIAGADALVMSLWPVEDVSATTFMSALYRARLRGGESTAGAMRHAYRAALAAVRRAHGYPHPHYWAPFIASGDWR